MTSSHHGDLGSTQFACRGFEPLRHSAQLLGSDRLTGACEADEIDEGYADRLSPTRLSARDLLGRLCTHHLPDVLTEEVGDALF
jgi:hypothetical protein